MALRRNEKQFLFLQVLPLIAIIIATMVLHLMGKQGAAWAVSTFGTMFVIIGVLFYVVFWDSKKRWPGLTPFQRWTKMVNFQR